MARSTTVWAAALVLASFSGSGPLLTTAEAMPAPGPQETQGQGRPRYYFPRHVKRQIVTNTTAPAAPTPASSSSKSEQLESRQPDFLTSLFGILDPKADESSKIVVSSSGNDVRTSTVTSIQEIIVTPVPEISEPLPGTGNQRPSPAPISEPAKQRPEDPESEVPEVVPSSPARGPSSSGVPPVVLRPTPSPEQEPEPSSSARAPLLGPVLGSSGLIPGIVAPATSTTPTPTASVAPSLVASSFQGPFIVPGSTGGGIPSSVATPTQSQGLVGGLLSTLLVPEASPTGVLPSSIALPTVAPASPSSEQPLLVQSSSGGIVVGITTALGTGATTPTPVASGAIPTSEAVLPSGPLDLPPILSSLVSEVSGVLPPGSAGPTAPASDAPVPTASGVLPPLVSSLVSDVSSLLPSGAPPSVIPSIISSLVSEFPPSATAPIVLPTASDIVSSIASGISSGIIPSGAPTLSGAVPSPSDSSLSLLLPSETPTVPPSGVSSVPTPIETSSGILPSGGIPGSGISSAPTVTPSPTQPSSIPASESTLSPVAPSSPSVAPPSSGNATISETPTFVIPSSTASTTESASVVAPSTSPAVTSKPTPVQSQRPIGSDSATTMIVGSSIIQETTSNAAPSATSSGIPSSLPKMIAPPGGVASPPTGDDFLGQVCFKWPLNYPFVSANDGGNQIFHYLPKAVADGLNISVSDVRNIGLRPLDTTAYQGFITTLALFTIPKDLSSKLAAQLRNPADPFWRNKDQTVNDLTNLINTACPLPAGKLPGENGSPNQAANPAATATGGPGDGGALGGDINSSRPVNASAAGIATGAIVGAIAYGAAMFFVARRYRNKRIAHQRSSSVPSTGSRMTYGSIPGGAAAWMHGARNGRITPGSRGSQGSSSTQGRSVRTQQISAPVMAENSLGWN